MTGEQSAKQDIKLAELQAASDAGYFMRANAKPFVLGVGFIAYGQPEDPAEAGLDLCGAKQ